MTRALATGCHTARAPGPPAPERNASAARTMRTTALTAVFLAEVRTLRRLARSWLLAFLAVGTTLAGYLFFASMHGSVSSFVPSVVTSPRFLVAPFGGYLVWFVLAATVFLAFDIGNRERRERIADAIDTRPVSNIELLAGRLAGVLATVAVPVVLGVALIQGVGALGRSLGWDVSVQFEPVSLAVFLALDVVPAIVLWVAIVFLLAAVLRLRLVVAIVALGLLVLAIWGLSQVPAWLLPYVAVAPDRLVSDLVSSIPDAATFVHRLSLLLLAGGLLVFAATCLQRPDTGSRAVRLVAATTPVVGGSAGIAVVVGHAHAELVTRAEWLAAQQAASGVDIDIRSVSGDVHIDPGKVLRINVAMKLALRDSESRTVLFRFNPGMETTAVRVDDQAVPFEHRDGLLSAVLPQPSGDEVTLEVRAHGIPNPDFAYLDSAIDHRTVVGANPLRELGTDASLFDRRYVALMPGVHWLPGSVASGPPKAFAQARRNVLTVDLVVEVPPGWLVAGPGRREPLGGDRYRFRPKAPVTEIVLLASDFHRVATTVDGIELELLLDPRHTASVEFFADDGPAVTDALTDIFEEADALGLGYPYDALRLVEVPGRLRGYGGGWRMETALALPGVLLLRERGFPTARFYAPDPAPQGFPREGVDRLKAFFKEDRTGADPLAGLARQLFLNQTAATGSGELALEYVCQALVARLLDDPGSYFSAHIYASSPTVQSLLADALTSVFAGGSGRVQADVFAAVRPPSVWQRAFGTALADLDTTDPGQAVNILTLKGEAVARSMLDGLGRDVTARFVATLRERYQGNSFNRPGLRPRRRRHRCRLARHRRRLAERRGPAWIHRLCRQDRTTPGRRPGRTPIPTTRSVEARLPKCRTTTSTRGCLSTSTLIRFSRRVGRARNRQPAGAGIGIRSRASRRATATAKLRLPPPCPRPVVGVSTTTFPTSACATRWSGTHYSTRTWNSRRAEAENFDSATSTLA